VLSGKRLEKYPDVPTAPEQGVNVVVTKFRGIAGLDWAALGIPDEAAYVARYCERTGLTIEGDWNFYLAYNMFRIAAILQGIMKRVSEGTASSAQAVDAGRRAKPMAELAWRYAQKVRT